MYTARLRDDGEVRISIVTSDDSSFEITARVVSPSHVERSTGTFRSPGSMIDLPVPLVARLADLRVAPEIGPVIGLIVHTVSRRAAAIGVFTAAGAARAWWAQPYNKLAKYPDILFLVVPVVEEISG